MRKVVLAILAMGIIQTFGANPARAEELSGEILELKQEVVEALVLVMNGDMTPDNTYLSELKLKASSLPQKNNLSIEINAALDAVMPSSGL